MKPPIFIIGNPRSGTTMFRLMLTCHPNICIPPECGWLIGLYPKWSNRCISNKQEVNDFIKDIQNPSVRKFETWALDIKQLKNGLIPLSYKEIISHIYQLYIKQHQPNKTRWGDKNNFFLHHIDTIDKLFPDALFIHLVRDGRDVACSYRDLKNIKGKYAPRLPFVIGDIAHRWKDNLEIIHKSLGDIDYRRSIILRYEDLVSNPESNLKMICDFIDEPFSLEMLKFSEYNKSKKLEPDEMMKWKEFTKEPLTCSRVNRWKKELTNEEQELFSFIARKTLVRYGYIK